MNDYLLIKNHCSYVFYCFPKTNNKLIDILFVRAKSVFARLLFTFQHGRNLRSSYFAVTLIT